MATRANSTTAPAVLLSEAELLALFDRGAGIDHLIERLIDILDTTDALSEDLEDGHDAELDYEGEATLGAPEQHHNQTKWGRGQIDADGELELSLGAPEQHPSPPYYPTSMRRTFDGRQTQWAAGNRNPARDEGESEPGYDLACGSEHDGAEPDVDEPILGAPENHDDHPDQRRWGQGSASDAELVNEDGVAQQTDGIPWQAGQENRRVARDMAKAAERIRTKKQLHVDVKFDPDEIQPGNLRWIGGQIVNLVGVAR